MLCDLARNIKNALLVLHLHGCASFVCCGAQQWVLHDLLCVDTATHKDCAHAYPAQRLRCSVQAYLTGYAAERWPSGGK